MISITVAGHVSRSELGQSNDGTPVLNFSLAHNTKGQDPIWFDCAIWGKRATALAPYINKGRGVTVVGQMTRREANGKTYLAIRVADMHMEKSDTTMTTTTAKEEEYDPFA